MDIVPRGAGERRGDEEQHGEETPQRVGFGGIHGSIFPPNGALTSHFPQTPAPAGRKPPSPGRMQLRGIGSGGILTEKIVVLCVEILAFAKRPEPVAGSRKDPNGLVLSPC